MSSSFGAKSHHKTMFAIALPMVISNIAAPLLGLVDTAIIGHLPDAIYLSAVALGAMVVSFIYLLAVFLRMSTTGLIAQGFGANDVAAQRRFFFDASLFALVIAKGLNNKTTTPMTRANNDAAAYFLRCIVICPSHWRRGFIIKPFGTAAGLATYRR